MKFTFMGFLQSKAIEMNLDDKDLSILRYFIDFKDSGKMVMKIINDKPFYWLKSDALIEELPILGIKSKDVLRRRLKKLVEANVLEFELIKKGGVYTFYGVGKSYIDLIADDTQKHPTQKSEPTDPKVGTLPTQKSEQNINLLKEPSIKYINSVCREVINFLNLKANTKYKSDSKATVSLISGRINDGFTIDDMKIVINNKCEEWKGTSYEKYLRPSTLFRQNKFEEYLNQKNSKNEEINQNKPGAYKPFNFDD